MEIHFQCNLSDYNEALKAQRSTKMIPRAIVAVTLILGTEIVAVNLGFRQGVVSLFIAASFLVLSVGVSILRPRWIKKDLQGHPNFQREKTVRIDDHGLHWRSDVDQGDTFWAAYTEYRETKNLFILFLGKRLIQVVPKRALSPAEIEELRGLLQARLPENAKRPALVKKSASNDLA